MKSPSEIAEEIVQWLKTICRHGPRDKCDECSRNGIKEAIESFGNQRFEEGKNSQVFELYELHNPDGTIEKYSAHFEERIKKESRRSALEEAAKVVEDNGNGDAFMAFKIRALIDRDNGKGK